MDQRLRHVPHRCDHCLNLLQNHHGQTALRRQCVALFSPRGPKWSVKSIPNRREGATGGSILDNSPPRHGPSRTGPRRSSRAKPPPHLRMIGAQILGRFGVRSHSRLGSRSRSRNGSRGPSRVGHRRHQIAGGRRRKRAGSSRRSRARKSSHRGSPSATGSRRRSRRQVKKEPSGSSGSSAAMLSALAPTGVARVGSGCRGPGGIRSCRAAEEKWGDAGSAQTVPRHGLRARVSRQPCYGSVVVYLSHGQRWSLLVPWYQRHSSARGARPEPKGLYSRQLRVGACAFHPLALYSATPLAPSTAEPCKTLQASRGGCGRGCVGCLARASPSVVALFATRCAIICALPVDIANHRDSFRSHH